MFVIQVTPIKKGFGRESISYFSASPIEEGSIISVPLRRKSELALVLSSEKAIEQRASLRSAEFSLRKIGEVKSVPVFSKAWMKAMNRFANYSAISQGEAVASLVPKVVLNNISYLQKFTKPQNQKVDARPSNFLLEAYQGDDEERFSHYKSIIREEFAKKRSVFLCLSMNEEIDEAKNIFEKGIEKYTFIFKASMTDKEFKKSLSTLLKCTHPVLIIASPIWLLLPRKDLGRIILENEASSSWKTFTRPFVDQKKFTEFFGEASGIKLVLGDLVLSVDSLWQYKSDFSFEFSSLNFRSSSIATIDMIDMNAVGEKGEVKSFHIISEELKEFIKETKERNKNLFIYSTRKGLSSVTICRDCGTQVLCNNCFSPVVLYKQAGEAISQAKNARVKNFFRCRQCGERRSADEVCKVCSSWRLMPLGVGVERIAEEINRIFPDANVLELNREATPTSLKAKALVDKFYRTPGSIIVGTEMALYYLKEPADLSAVASIDSLFSIPDFRIREKIFHTILKVRNLGREKFIIQVRNAERDTVRMALSGNLLDFYRREIKEREELEYPPFSVFIKITSRGSRGFVLKEIEKIKAIFTDWSPSIFESSSEREGAEVAYNCVIKVPSQNYPDENLYKTILSLPPHFEIKINPDNLL